MIGDSEQVSSLVLAPSDGIATLQSSAEKSFEEHPTDFGYMPAMISQDLGQDQRHEDRDDG